MLRRTFVILLSGILVTAALGVQSTRAQSGQTSSSAEAARTSVERLGVGKGAKTEITLRDKRKLKGYVSATGTDSFTFVEKNSGNAQMIAYADVANVKKPHGGPKTITWIIIAAAATAVIIGIVVKGAFCDGC